MKWKDIFTLRTVRRKIIMVSKLAGFLLIVSYLAATRLCSDPNLSLLLWLGFVIVLVLAVDFLMGRFLSEPVCKLNEAAARMARLDLSSPCAVHTSDEFGELSASLNQMAENLRQAFEELERVNERLEEDVEQKKRLLAERGELTDSLSHEMKTPLGVIRAYAEGLQDETNEEKRQKYAGVILEETERMSSLITTLLDLSALESGAAELHPERFDFVEFAETVVGRLLVDAPDADFDLQYELPEEPVCVDADRHRMEQVLSNLLVNAKKNLRPGGVLKLSLNVRDAMLTFSVYNEGASIPQEHLLRIWEKFYREKDAAYSGSGLGLAIVAQILSMHRFAYGAKNREGGVEFYFSMAVVDGL